ncbi:uncharacterized protein ISCGN_011703 [Ixodes scapularis]
MSVVCRAEQYPTPGVGVRTPKRTSTVVCTGTHRRSTFRRARAKSRPRRDAGASSNDDVRRRAAWSGLWRQAHEYLTCAENEEDTIVDGPTGPTGYVDVYCTSHGRAPRKCPQCASEIYTTVDAGKVESTVDACYSKKEKSHPLYKEYAAYLEKVQQKTEAIEKCVYEVIGQKRSQAAVMKPKTSAASTNPRKTRPTKG